MYIPLSFTPHFKGKRRCLSGIIAVASDEAWNETESIGMHAKLKIVLNRLSTYLFIYDYWAVSTAGVPRKKKEKKGESQY